MHLILYIWIWAQCTLLFRSLMSLPLRLLFLLVRTSSSTTSENVFEVDVFFPLFWVLIELRRLNWAWQPESLLALVRIVEIYHLVNMRTLVSKIPCCSKKSFRCAKFAETNFKSFLKKKKNKDHKLKIFYFFSNASNRVYLLSLFTKIHIINFNIRHS